MTITPIKIGPYNLIDYHGLSREEWEYIRYSDPTAIGGSDISVLLNLNRYSSRAQLFDQKLGLTPPPNLDLNASVVAGRKLEPVVMEFAQHQPLEGSNGDYMANMANDKKVNNIIPFDYTVWHDSYPWLRANVDGLDLGDYHKNPTDNRIRGMVRRGKLPRVKRVVEFKTMRGIGFDTYNSVFQGIEYKGLAPGYYSQVQHYMIVFLDMFQNEVHAGLFSLSDTASFTAYYIPYDDEMVEQILEQSYLFHMKLKEGVERLNNTRPGEDRMRALDEIRPEADYTDAWSKHFNENYAKKISIDNQMEGSDLDEELREKYLEVSLREKLAKAEKTEVSNQLKERMYKEDVSLITTPEGHIKFSNKRLYVK